MRHIVLNSLKYIAIMVLPFFLLLSACTALQAQTCPIKEGLYKSTLVCQTYNPSTQVLEKTYKTNLGFVTLRMTLVSAYSADLHKNSITIPTMTQGVITAYWNGKSKKFLSRDILLSTKQL